MDARQVNSTRRDIPGPSGNFLWGNLNELRRNRTGFLLDMARLYSDVVKYRVAYLTLYQVNNPEGIAHVLQGNHRNYTREVPGINAARLVLGNGLLTSEGDYWKRQRRLIQPVFHRDNTHQFITIILRNTNEMLARLDKVLTDGNDIDLSFEMNRLTLSIITECLLGTKVIDVAGTIARDIAVIDENISLRFELPFYPPPIVPTPGNRRFSTAITRINSIVYGIIAERRQKSVNKGDLLSMLLSAGDPGTGEGMSDRQLRYEIVTLTSAGRGTTASALTWSMYLLSRNPTIAENLQTEVEDVLHGRTLTAADLPSLSLVRRVLEESMRLYHPAWVFGRKAMAEDTICGYQIPSGAILLISPYVVHRDPTYWPEPQLFDPDRFLPARSQSRPRFAYFPFGGGPHQCIGKDFAMFTAQVVLATIAQKYRLAAAMNELVEPEALVGLTPRNDLRMKIHKLDT